MSRLPEDFEFSQSSLQDYVDCPRRFELRFIEQLRYPAPESEPLREVEAHARQGERFHHLVHQHLIGIPEATLSRTVTEEPLGDWWRAYLRGGLKDVPARRHPEMMLTAPLGEEPEAVMLVARFDLIALGDEGRAVIVDWKTSRVQPKREWFERRWQTRIYRYLLAAAGAELNNGRAIAPEQIEMVYWFPAYPQDALRFPYSEAEFHRDEADMLALVGEIRAQASFPLTADERRCATCTYRSLCNRGKRAGHLSEWEAALEADEVGAFVLSLDQVAEVAF